MMYFRCVRVFFKMGWSRNCDSPSGGSHDAASTIHSHSTAAPPFWRVMVHPKVVSKLVGQSDCSTQGVV